MTEGIYSICKSSWWIYIKIIAEVKDCSGTNNEDKMIQVAEGIWLKYADVPLIEGELFCQEDLRYFAEGLKMVQEKIRDNSLYKETLIIIDSVQFNPCDFQEEGLIAAIIEWASMAFGFQKPTLNVEFDKKMNKYIYDFNI